MSDLQIRPATPDDDPAVLGLLASALNWHEDDASVRLFHWKHRENPAGTSPAWVAMEDGALLGYRTFVRWEFLRGDGSIARAVRAVDTATAPAARGKGVFTGLTRHALDELEAEGVSFVFNTPNSSSLPGYLKMGWEHVTRLPVAARPASPTATLRVLRARTAADKWSIPTTVGEAALDVFDDPAVEPLLASQPTVPLATRRTAAFLRWRYGLPELSYRAVVGAGGVEGGVAVFRVRRRGAATEAAIVDVLAPDGDPAVRATLLREAARCAGADYALRLGVGGAGFVPVPRQGPTLVWRGVCDPHRPPADDWRLTLGDVELF